MRDDLTKHTAQTRPTTPGNETDLFDLLQTLPPHLLGTTLQVDPETGFSLDFANKLVALLSHLGIAAMRLKNGQCENAAASMAKFGKAISNQMTYSEYLERDLIPKCHGHQLTQFTPAHFTSSSHWPDLAAAVKRLDAVCLQIRECYNEHLDGRTEIDTRTLERLMHQACQTIYSKARQYERAVAKVTPAVLDPICEAVGWTVVDGTQGSDPPKAA